MISRICILILLASAVVAQADTPPAVVLSIPDTAATAPPAVGDFNGRMSKGDGTLTSENFRVPRGPSRLLGWDPENKFAGIPFATFELSGTAASAVKLEQDRALAAEVLLAKAADLTTEANRAKAAEATKASTTDLAALSARIVRPVTLTVAVPAVAVLATKDLNLPVPGAAVGGAVVLNYTDVTMQGNVAGMSVTAPGVVTVTLKAAVAISAGNRAFTVSVLNP